MRTRRRFTLADALVLSALAFVLGGLLIPAWGQPRSILGRSRENARRAACMNNIRQIGLAMKMYATDHDDRYMPFVTQGGREVPAVDDKGKIYDGASRSSFAVLMKKHYINTARVFICPSTKDKVPRDFPKDLRDADLEDLILPQDGCSYGWDPTKTGTAAASCALIADKPDVPGDAHKKGDAKGNSPNHDKAGQNVFYNDGHGKWAKTPKPDAGTDPDIYKGAKGYELSVTDAKIIR